MASTSTLRSPNRSSSSSSSRSVNGQQHPTVRSKVSVSRRSVTPTSRTHTNNNDQDSGRVRVAVRLRPRNADDMLSDADFADCVEFQPELKRLKLRKNNWSSESYRFDEVFTETASQRRVYEVVAKPVVESVLNGYNGTVMAYGKTGTGKTYTVGKLGKEDASERGIMVRALEDIISNTSLDSDCVEVSYLQLYMESIQDLLNPEKINIPISEDPKTGEVLLPGVAVVKIRDLNHVIQLLQIGEANRHAANTKMNTESSRSHAILMVFVRKSINENVKDQVFSQEKVTRSGIPGSNGIPTVRKSKLLIVDLAGSERLDKSGSEGHTLEEAKFINLSLTSLGKCINALAENSPHIPTRDSKLTRLLRDSFGGSARTSLIITIGPSARHHAETTSTIMFGQRAMKIVNMLKLKEEFDYESLCRTLENQVDYLTAEIERQQKLRENDKDELEKKLRECQNSFAEAETKLVTRSESIEKENANLELEMKNILNELTHQKDHNNLICNEVARLEMKLKHSKEHQLENSTYQKVLADTTQMYEKKIVELVKQLEDERARSGNAMEQVDVLKKLLNDHQMSIQQHQMESSTYQKALADTTQMYEKKVAEILKQLEDEHARFEDAEEQLDVAKKLLNDHQNSMQMENSTHQKALVDTTQMYEKKVAELLKQLDDQHARFEGAQEQLDLAKKLLHDHQTSMQKALVETTQMYEKKVAELINQLEDEHASFEVAEEQLDLAKKLLNDQSSLQGQKEIDELRVKLQEMYRLHNTTTNELESLESEYRVLQSEKATLGDELLAVRQKLLVEEMQRKSIENELVKLKKFVPENDDFFEDKKSYMKENIGKESSVFENPMGLHKSNQSRETLSGQRATIAKICEEVGLQKILALLTSEDTDVQIHAVKVVANLAAEDINQEKIVEEGGLEALLMLLRSSQNTTILRVASGAIANLAMNGLNQGLIVSKGGAQLLANTALKTDDAQTLRMVAGAIANLCGNEKLHMILKEDGGIEALLGMARSKNSDIIAQVARGMANFAKCESRGIIQGHKKGRSLLMEDGVLTWLIANLSTTSASTRRHVELALCHLAQNGNNVEDFISSGGVKELVRISTESSREDIRNLAKKTLKLNSTFQAHMVE